MKQDMIVILDLGSTENTTLARAIRELGVYSEIYPHDITAEELEGAAQCEGRGSQRRRKPCGGRRPRGRLPRALRLRHPHAGGGSSHRAVRAEAAGTPRKWKHWKSLCLRIAAPRATGT